jgi:hypothetical protein
MSEPIETKRLEKIADGLYWSAIYWLDGDNSKKGGERSEIRSGVPHLGWDCCFVIDKDEKSKMITLFCPFAYEGFQVSRQSYEYTRLQPPTQWNRETKEESRRPFDREWHVRNLYEKWENAVKRSWQADFDTAVVIFRLMGLEVPQGVPEGMEAKKSGGKEADVLAYFWPAGGKSVRECMVDMTMTRSNVLSNLYLLNKNHGIAYELKGDQAIITMPGGCEDPYAPE